MKLPQEFTERMRRHLGEEFDEFLACYDQEGHTGLRINTQKISPEAFLAMTPFRLSPVPWTKNGFYYLKEDTVTKHPHYFAGLYYIQEPSAMLPASRLPIEPGHVVLDLCAAPGGKATELSSRLGGEGLLVANDASASRAKALYKNLAVWGSANCCITGEMPQKLLEHFGCCFDRILVDAPCSGEGMFRKDTGLIDSWKEHGPEYYAEIQKEILSCAVQMLKEDGMLLYSTCTFSEEEDEDVIGYILEQYPQMELVEPEGYDGFVQGKAPYEKCIRVWPHKVEGEGHFLALLHKRWKENTLETDSGQSEKSAGERMNSDSCLVNGTQLRKNVKTNSGSGKQMESDGSLQRYSEKEILASHKKMPEEVRVFLEQIPEKFWKGYVYQQIGEQCLLVPPYKLPKRLRYLRTGIGAGTYKKGRFEPSQQLAMLLGAEDFPNILNLSSEDTRVIRYLKGETVELTEEEDRGQKGWVLICTDGHGLGWGKYAGGSIKNKYYPGWRLQ